MKIVFDPETPTQDRAALCKLFAGLVYGQEPGKPPPSPGGVFVREFNFRVAPDGHQVGEVNIELGDLSDRSPVFAAGDKTTRS